MFAACVLTLAVSVPVISMPLGASMFEAQRPVTAVSEPDDLEPDRPDVTNGTHIVDVGVLQIEAGGLWTRVDPGRHSAGTPTTIRLGLSDWFEARLSGDGLLSATDASGSQVGFGNVQLGAKLRLWSDPGGVPVLSILPTINLPTASESKGLGTGQVDVTIAVLTGTDFLTRGHIDINYGIGRIGAGSGLPRFTQHLVSWSISAEVPGPVTPYVEGFWFSRQDPDGGRVVALDTGAIYVINPRLAFDGGIQFGITEAAPSLAAFGGVSVALGNVLGDHGVHERQRQTARRSAARAARGGR